MRVYVGSVGIWGPGLPGWQASRAILAGLEAYRYEDTPKPVPGLLPPTERRRSSDAVRTAVAVAQEAMQASDLGMATVATVFASSDGDGDITHKMCEALATPERDVSPTLFHNSVYNAPAGYWSIATGNRSASTSLCAFDTSFAAGLLEAASQVVVEQCPVLLVAFDNPFPAPLSAFRPMDHAFAAALLLMPNAGSHALMEWDMSLEESGAPVPCPELVCGELARNAAARCLPLLAALARGAEETLRIEAPGGSHVVVRCRP
jgi:hypothetical protein